jgi:hypothetical protein
MLSQVGLIHLINIIFIHWPKVKRKNEIGACVLNNLSQGSIRATPLSCLIKLRSPRDTKTSTRMPEIHLINPLLLGEECRPIIIPDAGGVIRACPPSLWRACPQHDIQPASPERERWRAGPPVFLVTKTRGKALHFVPQGTLSTFSASVPYDSQQTQCSDQLYLTINVKM